MSAARILSHHSEPSYLAQALHKFKNHAKANSLMLRLGALSSEISSPTLMERMMALDPDLAKTYLSAFNAGVLTGKSESCASLKETLQLKDVAFCRKWSQFLAVHLLAIEIARVSTLKALCVSRRALATAVACEWIALQKGWPAADYFLAGLMGPVGVLALSFVDPQGYCSTTDSLAGSTSTLEQVERMTFHCTHLEVAAALSKSYGLPACIALAYEELSAEELSFLPASLSLASSLAHQLGYDLGMANCAPNIPDPLLTQLGLGNNHIESLAGEVTSCVSRLQKLS